MKQTKLLYAAVCFTVIFTIVVSSRREPDYPTSWPLKNRRRDTEQKIKNDVSAAIAPSTALNTGPTPYKLYKLVEVGPGDEQSLYQSQYYPSHHHHYPIAAYPSYSAPYESAPTEFTDPVVAATSPPSSVPASLPTYNSGNTLQTSAYQGANFGGSQGSYYANQGQPTAHSREKDARILSSSYDLNPEDSSFQYSFETDNGLAVKANGYMKSELNEVIQGEYLTIGPNGKVSKITYIADENGYQPSGEGIPTTPPIIAKALAYLKSLPSSTETPLAYGTNKKGIDRHTGKPYFQAY